MGGRREYLLYGRRYVRQSFQVLLDREMHSFVLELGASSKLPVHSGALPRAYLPGFLAQVLCES